jgi:hypothetical protein
VKEAGCRPALVAARVVEPGWEEVDTGTCTNERPAARVTVVGMDPTEEFDEERYIVTFVRDRVGLPDESRSEITRAWCGLESAGRTGGMTLTASAEGARPAEDWPDTASPGTTSPTERSARSTAAAALISRSALHRL